MHTLSYTISPVLQQTLKGIEVSRQHILLLPLSLVNELHYRWEANVSRIYYSLHLAHSPVNQREIARVLTSPNRRAMLPAETEIINYKFGIDYITREWFVNTKPVMPHALQTLYSIVADDKTRLPENEIMEMLIFLQTSRENPLVQAFIAYIQFSLMVPSSEVTGKMARLLPYLFLYKAGLDFRGLLVLEEYFYKNERLLRDLQAAIERRESVSVWIEHFVQSIASQLEVVEKAISQDSGNDSQKIWQLTERQKEILLSFDQPGLRITNRKVQQLFHISQITASRDLAKLSALSLLFSYGKGRSVYYTRA
jgi:hypothetical protein